MKRAQTTLASTRFEKYTKTTRRAQFLAEMDLVVPWQALCARIEPVYRKAGNGRPPVGVERMLWFNLSDPAAEEALYDSPTLRAFVGIDLGQEPVQDETTVCKFRHLLEQHDLGRVLFDEVTQHQRAQGLAVSTGTIVHEERDGHARSRDASDAEGPAMVLRHEGPLRGRQPEQAHSLGRSDAGEHP